MIMIMMITLCMIYNYDNWCRHQTPVARLVPSGLARMTRPPMCMLCCCVLICRVPLCRIRPSVLPGLVPSGLARMTRPPPSAAHDRNRDLDTTANDNTTNNNNTNNTNNINNTNNNTTN